MPEVMTRASSNAHGTKRSYVFCEGKVTNFP